MAQGISVPHLVGDLEERFRDLETRFHEAFWDSQVEATREKDERRAELELELRRLKGDPDSFSAVMDALNEELHDPVVKRQLEVLRLSLTGNQMDDDHRVAIVELATGVESEFATFRPTVNGRRLTDNEILEVLSESNDEMERREVWMASKKVGAAVADRVRDLARTRNEVALSLGFADYYRMALELQELPEEWLFDHLDELDDLTREPYARWKSEVDARLMERFGVDRVAPWHYADPFFQEAPAEGAVSLDDVLGPLDASELAVKTFDGWGIDVRRVIEGSDLYPKERKCQHAFCLDVDRSGRNVRILANVVPGERWITTMLHESGHAAYDISIDKRLPYLLRRASHIFVTEAIAILCGRLVRDGRWLRDVAGLDATKLAALDPQLRRANAAESLQFSRWGLVMAHFERDLYSDPEGDLDDRWWDYVERFQLIPRPDDVPVNGWASKIHLAVAPVYYHNYLLGEMLASQLAHAIEDECGGLVGDRAAGEFFQQRVFRPGAFLRWNALIEESTGAPLTPRAFAEDVSNY